MANSLGTLNGTIVAQRVLEFLRLMFPALTRIASNYSDDRLLFNQTLVTRVPVVGSANDYDQANGYVSQNSNTVDVPIKIDHHKHVSISFNDQEVSSTNRNLIDEQAAPAAYALGLDLFTYVFGLVTGANIPNEFVTATANYARPTVTTINGILNKRGVSPLGRFGLVSSAAYANLADDITIVGNQNNPTSNTIATGVLTNVHGVDIIELPFMNSATAEKLNGFFGNKSALAVATCVPKDPGQVLPGLPIPGRIYTVTDALTGMTIMVREFYDMGKGKYQYTLTWMYGAAIGIAKAGERVVTAATAIDGTVVDTLA